MGLSIPVMHAACVVSCRTKHMHTVIGVTLAGLDTHTHWLSILLVAYTLSLHTSLIGCLILMLLVILIVNSQRVQNVAKLSTQVDLLNQEIKRLESGNETSVIHRNILP